MTRPSLCFVASNALPALQQRLGKASDAPFGGAETQMATLGIGLAERGHRVAFVCTGERPEITEETLGPIHLVLTPPPTGREGRLTPLRALHAGLARADSDCFYQRCALPVTGLVARHARRRGKRFIFGIANDRDVDGRARQVLGRLRHALYRHGLRRADAIVAQSEAQRRFLPEPLRSRALVIPSAFDVAATALRPDPSSPCVIWVGNLQRKKRPLLLLDIARALPQVSFLAVAPEATEPELAAEFRRQAAGITNLETHGRIPHAELDAFYRRATLLLNTSDAEGVPNVFLEAWARGIPVVTLGVDPDGVIARKGLGVVTGASDVAAVLTGLLGDSRRRRQAAGAARAHMQAAHGLDPVIHRYQELLQRLTR